MEDTAGVIGRVKERQMKIKERIKKEDKREK